MKPLKIMDTTIRDGQQSLWATRMAIGDMLPILPKMDQVGYWAIEAWGGATFDTCLRFLDENPWERLRAIKKHCPRTPLSMLVRGQNLVGYHHYSTDVVTRFVAAAHRNGVDVFRVFDALNDIRNVRGLRRCRQGVRCPFRGRHLLHDEPGAHARQLRRLRRGAQGARRRLDLREGHGRPAHALPHRAPHALAARGDRAAHPPALPLRRRHGAGELHQGHRGRRGHRRHRERPARLRQLPARRRDDRRRASRSRATTPASTSTCSSRSPTTGRSVRTAQPLQARRLLAHPHAGLQAPDSRRHDEQPGEPARHPARGPTGWATWSRRFPACAPRSASRRW